MKVKLREIDPILDIPAICDLLKVSEAQFHRKKALLERQGLLVEIRPSLDRRPRYSGVPFVKMLQDETQRRLINAELMEMEKTA